MKKYLSILSLVALLVSPAICFGQAKVGTAGAQFLEIGVSARAMAMGEAFIGISNDASALYYNPAGLSILTQKEVLLTFIKYPADINFYFGGAVFPMPSLAGALGLSFTMLSMDDMPITDYSFPSGNGQTFTAADYALGLSYSAGLTDRFSVGLTLKYIRQNIETSSASGMAADLGTYYDTGFRNFRICMAISNFGQDLTFIEESYPLPTDFRFGTSIDIIQTTGSKLTLAIQGQHPNDNLEKYGAGLEYWFNDMIALRAGKKFNQDYYDKNDFGGGLTFGFGVGLPVSTYHLAVDYAYQDMGFLDSANRFSLSFRF